MSKFIQHAVGTDVAGPVGATTLVVGGGPTGRGMADTLAGTGRPVAFVDEDAVDRGEEEKVEVLSERVTDPPSLRAVLDEVGEVGSVVVVGPDSEALLVTVLAKRELREVPILAVVSDPQRRSAFEDLGVESLDLAALLGTAIREELSEVQRA
jgi:Trk K+ transport system NAD-binding subunit